MTLLTSHPLSPASGSSPVSTPPAGGRAPTLYRTLHRVRAAGLAMGFVILALHLMERGHGAGVWALLVLQFLLYPQALAWRTRRAADPKQAELTNFQLDALSLGVWMGALGYPLWVSFALLIGNLVSVTLYAGLRGALRALALFLLGGLSWLGLSGQPLAPQTSPGVTALCMVGLSLFLLQTAYTAYLRNRKLQDTRSALRQREHELHQANTALQQQVREVRILQDQLQEQAHRDPLTGLYNRRYLDATLERELARCKREGLPLTVLLIDIDHFKRINDTYGHQAGDAVLTALAALLAAQARTEDVVCRYGGEEFLLLLPGMPLETALARAEQWRQTVTAMRVDFGQLALQVTLSIGVATYPGHGTSPDQLVRVADHAMYRAKTAGRNCVCVGDDKTRLP